MLNYCRYEVEVGKFQLSSLSTAMKDKQKLNKRQTQEMQKKNPNKNTTDTRDYKWQQIHKRLNKTQHWIKGACIHDKGEEHLGKESRGRGYKQDTRDYRWDRRG